MNTTTILRFFGIFIIAYLLLNSLSNTKPVQTVHARSIAHIARVFLPKALPKAYFEVATGKKTNRNDLFIRFSSHKSMAKAKQDALRAGKKSYNISLKKFTISVSLFWIVPFTFLLSLVIATPIPLKKRMQLLLITLLGFILFLCFKLYVYTYFRIGEKMIGIYEFNTNGISALEKIKTHLGIGSTIVFLMAIWILTTYKLMPTLIKMTKEQSK